jgi:phosphodiesterase/alkaline phosphatase D-like protein
MPKALVFVLALSSTIAASSLLTSGPAGARDDMAKMDCTQAEAMFTDAVKSHVGAMTGDVDKDFAMIVMDHEKATSTIMKVEAQCGKDPKMKAMAAKQEADADARMTMFRNQGMSQ